MDIEKELDYLFYGKQCPDPDDDSENQDNSDEEDQWYEIVNDETLKNKI